MTKHVGFVADTNVIISRLLFSESIPAFALAHAATTMKLLLSPGTFGELEDVLSRPKFEKYLLASERIEFLRKLRATALLVTDVVPLNACRDPKDDKFLSLAVSGGATLILSGDDDLLALHPFQGISIVSPRQYLERVRERGV